MIHKEIELIEQRQYVLVRTVAPIDNMQPDLVAYGNEALCGAIREQGEMTET